MISGLLRHIGVPRNLNINSQVESNDKSGFSKKQAVELLNDCDYVLRQIEENESIQSVNIRLNIGLIRAKLDHFIKSNA